MAVQVPTVSSLRTQLTAPAGMCATSMLFLKHIEAVEIYTLRATGNPKTSAVLNFSCRLAITNETTFMWCLRVQVECLEGHEYSAAKDTVN